MRRPLRTAAITLALYALFCAIVGIMVAEMTLHPQRRKLDAQSVIQALEVARSRHATIEDISISAEDRIVLRAWLIRPDKSNGDTVLLLHGLSDNRIGMIGYAEPLLDHGYSVLLPDARAHGESGGALATYGLLERLDVRDWVNWLRTNEHPHCVYGFGESMGAAELLQSLDRNNVFCAVAVESPFSTFREIGYDRIGQFFHTGPWLGRTLLRPVIEIAFAYSRWQYHLDLIQVSPELAVSSTRTPVLLIHGQIDSNIPLRHSRRIKTLVPTVGLWEVPDADHCGAISADPEEFQRRLLGWFSNHTGGT